MLTFPLEVNPQAPGQHITGITKNIADTIPDTFGDREMTFILELMHNKTEINENTNKKIDN